MDAPKAGLRQRLFAWALAHFNTRYERFATKYKLQLFAGLTGTVLEIGPGTGANLRYLNSDKVQWIGVDPNPFMQPYLREEANKLGMQIEVRTGTADSVQGRSVSSTRCLTSFKVRVFSSWMEYC